MESSGIPFPHQEFDRDSMNCWKKPLPKLNHDPVRVVIFSSVSSSFLIVGGWRTILIPFSDLIPQSVSWSWVINPRCWGAMVIPSDERSNPFTVMKFHRLHPQSVVLCDPNIPLRSHSLGITPLTLINIRIPRKIVFFLPPECNDSWNLSNAFHSGLHCIWRTTKKA